jgi:hypothetical protein
MAKESGTPRRDLVQPARRRIQQGLMKLANPFMPAMKRWLGEATTYLGGPDGKSGFFARASKFMAVLPGNITSGRADFAAYNIGAIIGNHKFDPAIEKGVRVVHNLGVIVKDVLVPALRDFSVVLAPVVLLLEHLDSITGFVADHSTAFQVALDARGRLAAYKLASSACNGADAAGVLDAHGRSGHISSSRGHVRAGSPPDAQRKGVMLVVDRRDEAWTAAQWLLNARWTPTRSAVILRHRRHRRGSLPRLHEDQAVPGLRQRPLGRHEGLRGLDPAACGTNGREHRRPEVRAVRDEVSPAGRRPGRRAVAQWWLNPAGALGGRSVADRRPDPRARLRRHHHPGGIGVGG